MKKLIILILLSISTLSVSCEKKKTEDKKTDKAAIKKDSVIPPNEASKKTFTLLGDAKVKWTGYKTTDKLPVSGTFKTVKLENIHAGANAMEALDGIAFSIPVDTIFSDLEERDTKLKKIFFGAMADTAEIKGSLVTKTGKESFVNLTMNGVTSKLPVTLKVDGDAVALTAKIDLKTWKGEGAVAAIHKACEILHTGKDGVPKTWDEVLVEVTGKLSVK